MQEEFKGYPRIITYALGMAGWAIMFNLISVMIIYFYMPPVESGLPVLVPEVNLFGLFTVFSLILASGRVFDAVTDPVIAWLSDRSGLKLGRRRPFMMIALLPTLAFTLMIFLPRTPAESDDNFMWLFLTQAGFYLSLTLYGVPYNALMPELARTKDQKLIFSTILSLMYMAGMIISAQVPLIASLVPGIVGDMSLQNYYQIAIAVVATIGFLFMLTPVAFINEKRYCESNPVRTTLAGSLFATLRNRNFLLFLFADSSYFITLTLISSGIFYYVKVLLGLEDALGSKVIAILVVLSLALYPLVVKLARRFGKKPLIVLSFFLNALLFLIIFGLGKYPIQPETQLYLIAAFAAFPTAVLGILPYTIVAEIAEADGKETGEQKEGMFYAARTFSDKLGQTIGVVIFAMLIPYGKDAGNDMGIRLSALAGMAICLFAGVLFLYFKKTETE